MPLDQIPDAELLKRAVRGDELAFTELYRRRQGGIFRFALQMTGSQHVAEEVTQEVFMAVIRGMNAFDSARGSVQAWLYGIARNCVLRHFRRERTALPLGEMADVGVLSSSRDDSIDAVRRAVLALPEPFREAVVLCDLQELTYQEAADALGVPIGTVRSRVSRGRGMLASFFRSRDVRCVV
ncbi:MAG TPA: sigma-70 family RNA polymerase sigma factor [Bryobacteraceae bacterium]|nr:sigma-70 family RNA polymerase sigma factor [Bryobacteraceae bacterium]